MGGSETELSSASCHKQEKTTKQEGALTFVLNIPPHAQDTFYIAINSAILAAGNKEGRKYPPPSRLCFIHVFSS